MNSFGNYESIWAGGFVPNDSYGLAPVLATGGWRAGWTTPSIEAQENGRSSRLDALSAGPSALDRKNRAIQGCVRCCPFARLLPFRASTAAVAGSLGL